MVEWLSSLSYVGIFIGLVLTGAGLPLPEELLVIIAGVASYNGDMNPWLALGVCLTGALAGDCAMYAIGCHFGRGLLQRRGWYAKLLNAERERRVETILERHFFKTLLCARFLAGLRMPVYIAAGILRVPFRRFFLADAFCALLVIPLFFCVAYVCGEPILESWRFIRKVELGITITVVAAATIALFLLFRHKKRLQRVANRADDPNFSSEDSDSGEPVEESRSLV